MLDKHLSTATGVEAVGSAVSAYEVVASADGLEFASPDLAAWKADQITIPARLAEFLADIRLLRRVPLSYLVPDPDLLPPESIRFFHVNQTWVDRVIDGVISNTTVGTVDFHYTLSVLAAVRSAVDPAPNGMTGMLIRSELVRRWPTMVVQAYSDPNAPIDAESTVQVLRAEPVSRDILIALFAGQPARVHLREPFDGVRYGVEPPDDVDTVQTAQEPYVVDHRDKHGAVLDDEVRIRLRTPLARRRLHVEDLLTKLAALPGGSDLANPRGIALHLEQRPYVQVFRTTVAESAGSKPAPAGPIQLSNGHSFTLGLMQHALFQGSEG